MIYKAPKSQKESGRIGWWTLGGSEKSFKIFFQVFKHYLMFFAHKENETIFYVRQHVVL